MSNRPGRGPFRLLPALFLVLAAPGAARVVSYAPVTDASAIPAVQKRAGRHYLLMEWDQGWQWDYQPRGRFVLYDSRGERDPKVILPAGGPGARISAAALREGTDGVPVLLALTDAPPTDGENPDGMLHYLLSADGGASWRDVGIPGQMGWGLPGAPSGYYFPPPDTGGPIAREHGSQIRLGNERTPFFVTAQDTDGITGLWVVPRTGPARMLVKAHPAFSLRLVGGSADGSQVLVAGHLVSAAGTDRPGVFTFDANGLLRQLGNADVDVDGWITPQGFAYGTVNVPGTASRVVLFDGRDPSTKVAEAPAGGSILACPTADGAGAWIVERGRGLPTVLSSSSAGNPPVEAWRDVSGPEVEAIIPGASGRTLLVQVHRDRRLFKDPALAVWEVGQPAPRAYDELFLNEILTKGFVHVDVDRVAFGDPFVFDSGSDIFLPPMGGGPSSGGGGDVVQEGGVVRGSLRQRLVVPAVARTYGQFGASWRTDLLLHNPSDSAQDVTLEFARGWVRAGALTLRLSPHEIRAVTDVLGTLFSIDSGSGALFLTPVGDGTITAVSRTYTSAAGGTYGMSVPAVDVFAATSPRFPVSYAAALQGEGFRTNVIATDLGGRGAKGTFALVTPDDGRGPRAAGIWAPASGQEQVNGLADALGVSTAETGGVKLQLSSGEGVGSVIVIDNTTNDPAYFPPDLPTPTVRTLPAIVDADGAFGAHWRTDLFLVNPTVQPRSVFLAAKPWTSGATESRVTINMLPHESRVIRDALPTLFGMRGVARLQFSSTASIMDIPVDGIRLTARVYTRDAAGGTYGSQLPPLNSFQSAGAGESLEILGPVGGPGLRTNLALVDLTPFADGTEATVKVEVFDEKGTLADQFETSVPIAGGRQIDDLFRARGLGDGPKAALIRVSPARGLVAAYATLIDGGTGDPTFYGAALAAR